MLLRTAKPKTHRGKREVEKREPKIVEGPKHALFLRGAHTSDICQGTLKDLYALKKPHAVLFARKNAIVPFEDASSLEFFSDKNNCSLFALASHNKKRPHNLVLGRFFDHHLLDMFELGIESFRSISSFSGAKCSEGSKPAMIFQGQLFEQKDEYKELKGFFLDFFRGETFESINLAAVDHAISITADDAGKIYFRVFTIQLKRSGTRLPRIELSEMGPAIDFTWRRHKPAAPDVLKEALKQPRTLKPKKEKNKETDVLGKTYGRIHLGQQDLSKLATRKMKGLRKRDANEDGDVPSASDASGAPTKRARTSTS